MNGGNSSGDHGNGAGCTPAGEGGAAGSPPPDESKRPATPEPPPEPKPVEPAQLPPGFWKRADYILHHPERIVESLRRDEDLWSIARALLVIAIGTAALYGAVMGATALLHGEPFSFGVKLLMMVNTAIKTPVLFLLTLAIVLPPIYVSNSLAGVRLSFRQVVVLLLAACAIMAVVLCSMATVVLFFALTSASYNFIKLLHVLVFAYAGIVGVVFLFRSFRTLARETAARGPLLVVWLLLYGFVGTQLAWILRPFIFSPGMPFEVFRERSGNFYESVWNALMRLVG